MEVYYSQCIQTFPLDLSILEDIAQSSTRILEIIDIQSSEDGECYAQKSKVLFGLVDDGALDAMRPVSETVVETVLNHIRGCESTGIMYEFTSTHTCL